MAQRFSILLMYVMRTTVVAAIVLLAGTSFSAPRQDARACPYTIEGRVTGSEGALQDARVLIVGMPIGTATDTAGRYRLTVSCAMQHGPDATVRVLHIGYNQATHPIVFGAEQTIHLDVGLHVASTMMMGEVVTVVGADRPMRPVRYGELRSPSPPSITIRGPYDHASYSAIQRFLLDGEPPPPEAFDVEGLIEHVPLSWPPKANDAPMALAVDEIAAPWASGRRIVRASLLARPGRRFGKPRNVVLVMDAGGLRWHDTPDVSEALGDVVEQLDERDRVSIVAYNGPHGTVLSAASGADHARIRTAIDSVTQGPVNPEKNILRIVEDEVKRGAGAGRESRVVILSDATYIREELGSPDIVEDAHRLRALGARVDVLAEAGIEHISAQVLSKQGGGKILQGTDRQALRGALGSVFGVDLALRASRPEFVLDFDPRKVARRRCLNDVGGLAGKPPRSVDPELIFAGRSLSVLCEIELASGASSGEVTVTARYRDPAGATRSLTADALPDTSLHDESRFLADVAGFGLLLRRDDTNGWSLADLAADVRTTGGAPARTGYVAELGRLIDAASKVKRR